MNQPRPVSRRNILKSGLAAAALTPLGTLARGESAAAPAAGGAGPWRGLKVGIASYSFRGLPIDVCVADIKRVNLPYVSIKSFHIPLESSTEQRKALAQKFRDAGITPLSCGNIPIKDEASARQAFEYARDIGVPTIVCAPTPESLAILDKLVKEFDIRIAIHNHGPESPHFKSPMDVWPAVQSLDPRVGLCIDIGHTARAGTDPAEAIRTCKARLYDLHMKDISTVHAKNTKCEVIVGRGVLDIPGIAAALLEIGFAGHVGFEFEPDPKDPLPGTAESVGYLKGVLRELPHKA